MIGKKLKLSQVMLAGVIVIAMFVYSVELQPIATGGLNLSPYQMVDTSQYSESAQRFIEFLEKNMLFLHPWSLINKNANTLSLNTFRSYDALRNFLKNECSNNDYCYWEGYRGDVVDVDIAAPTIMMADGEEAGSMDVFKSNSATVDFSQTNIQVAGVDEPDTVKTDGTYLYLLANSKIYIIKAYPAEDASVLSNITLNSSMDVKNLFINGDKLVVFATSYRHPYVLCEPQSDWYYPRYSGVSTTVVNVYDISDHENPELENEIEIDGSYFNARMIDNHVYVVATEYTYDILYGTDDNETLLVPQITIDGDTKQLPSNQIYYVDIPERIDTMTHVISINLDNDAVVQKSFLLGSSQTMYVSENNIFLAYSQYGYIEPSNEDEGGRNGQKTLLHKISIDNGDISYIAEGEVPGRILNQFSMDEHNGFFRIATTISGYQDNVDTSTNNMYVLDENLEVVGRLEGIAPGESIYSVRFMGARAYMVTFRHIDPLFVIDLGDPEDPQILGKLKIPGYSEYLHPLDETHLIGIGKEVDASIDADKIHTEGAVYYTAIQGVKIAIFDVSDVENPIELHKEVIGDRGTESLAATDHKAFLFDRQRGLLVIPITLAELKEGQPKNMQGDFTFQGAYVYDISLEDGFNLRGRVTHIDDEQEYLRSGYYFRSSQSVTRSLYIDNVLYTISDSMVKMNDLSTINEINSVTLD